MKESLALMEISKSYKGKSVLSRFSFTFKADTVYAIVGTSGAGKSTLLKIINLLEEPDQGLIFYDNHKLETTNSLPFRRRMALVHQKPILFSGTVFENCAYGLKMRGQKAKEYTKKVLDILSFVGLEEKEKQRAGTLSGGEAQRLALARAIILNPEILLLDEPTANLDAANIKLIEELLKKISQSLSITIILVTHNLAQAKRLADEMLFLADGQLIEAKSKGDFFSNPENELTKEFLAAEYI